MSRLSSEWSTHSLTRHSSSAGIAGIVKTILIESITHTSDISCNSSC